MSNFLILLRGHWSQTLLWLSRVIGVLPSNLAEYTHNGTKVESYSVHIKRNLRDSENDGKQKVIFQGLESGPSSHQILIGQPIQFLPPALFTG
jgi:hypothetical protein